MLMSAGKPVYFSQIGDYRIKERIFEIGGPNKTRKQVKSVEDAILVKDVLTAVGPHTIPLIYFGFLY